MPQINFSYPFPKLMNEQGHLIRQARLLQVLPIDLRVLTAEMLDYDTNFGAYPLPKQGAFLMLIFQKPGSIHLFTTLRRSTPGKLDYYTAQVGERFDVIVKQTAP